MDKPLNEATHEAIHPAPQGSSATRAMPFESSPFAHSFTPVHDNTMAFIQEVEQLVLRQQEPLAVLKLAAYAADAMRVLGSLGRQADMSPALADTLKDICPDWRNPGALDDPADMIAVTLYFALGALQKNPWRS